MNFNTREREFEFDLKENFADKEDPNTPTLRDRPKGPPPLCPTITL